MCLHSGIFRGALDVRASDVNSENGSWRLPILKTMNLMMNILFPDTIDKACSGSVVQEAVAKLSKNRALQKNIRRCEK